MRCVSGVVFRDVQTNYYTGDQRVVAFTELVSVNTIVEGPHFTDALVIEVFHRWLTRI